MAVDTAAKRRSVVTLLAPGSQRHGVTPTGASTAAARAHLLGLYAGSLTGTPPADATPTERTYLLDARRTYLLDARRTYLLDARRTYRR